MLSQRLGRSSYCLPPFSVGHLLWRKSASFSNASQSLPDTECNYFFKLLTFNELQLSRIFGQQNGNKKSGLSGKHLPNMRKENTR